MQPNHHYTVFVEGKGPELVVAAWCPCATCQADRNKPKHWFVGRIRGDYHLDLTHDRDEPFTTFRAAVGEARGY